MAKKFRIPDRIEELEDSENFPNFYTVSVVYGPNELRGRLADAECLYKSNGPDFILETFEVFYSATKYFHQLEPKDRDEAWIILNRALNKLEPQLNKFIENFQLNLSQRVEMQNKLLMIVYLFVSMCEMYEEDDLSLNQDSSDQPQSSSGRGRGKAGKKPASTTTRKASQLYQDNRMACTNTILKIFVLNLERFFEPAHFLNSFVNIITRYAYRIVENSTTARQMINTQLFRNVSDIIGIALEKYNHSLNYCMKIIELLQAKETLVPTLAHLVVLNVRNHRHHLLIREILEQINSIDVNELSRDSSGPKAISLFLIQLGTMLPEQMFKCILDLFEFLEQDSYLLRNATLEIICGIVVKLFKAPNKNRDVHIKDKLLDKLEAHIYDITSYTRSKVMNLWCILAQEETIPLDRINRITKLIIGRLEDKACFVRKGAIHFLTQIIKVNPFMIMNRKNLLKFLEKYKLICNLNVQLLNSMHETQRQKFDDILNQRMENDNENEDLETENLEQTKEKRTSQTIEPEEEQEVDLSKKQKLDIRLQTLAEQWVNLEKLFFDYWKRMGHMVEFGKEETAGPDQLIPENCTENVEIAFEHFRQLIIKQEFEKALHTLFAIKSLFPNERVFQFRKNNNSRDSGESCSIGRAEIEEDDGEDSGLDNNEDDVEQNPQTSANRRNQNNEEDEGENSPKIGTILDYLDQLFILSITNFKPTLKLPYEIDLAKLVFLAPLLNFGQSNVVESESGKNSSLNTMLNQQNEELIEQDSNITNQTKIVEKFRLILYRLREAIAFTDMIASSIPTITVMLNSRNSSDAQEAMKFFTYSFKMEIENSIIGIRKMLKSIFSKEKSVRDTLLEAFSEIYLNVTPPSLPAANATSGTSGENPTENNNNLQLEQDNFCDSNPRNQVYLEVKNLSNMILELNQGELICAEAIIREIYHTKKFNKIHLQILWERYAMKLSNTGEEDSRAALIIIGMLASAQPTMIQNEANLDTIIQISLKQRRNDYRLVSDTCDVLLKAFRQPATESGEYFFKLPREHQLFEELTSILQESIVENPESPYWNRMASGIVKVIYYLAEHADLIVSGLVERCYHNVVQSSTKVTAATTNSDMESDMMLDQIGGSSQQLQQPSSSSQLSSRCGSAMTTCTTTSTTTTQRDLHNLQICDVFVARFITILGDIALNILIYFDSHLMRELKIRQYIKDKEKMAAMNNVHVNPLKDGNKRGSAAARQSDRSRFSIGGGEGDGDSDEEGILGPDNNEDPSQERIALILNEQVLFDKNGILSKFTRTIEIICSDYQGSHYSFVVRLAATIALAKFMVLSLRYTRQNRTILADILEKSRDADIRSNAIISFGDLLLRFPNEIEHYSGKIFACLTDQHLIVRSNALIVLSRLILADMIKPKGHISKIARLVTDPIGTICSAARLFFIELSKKNNIYIYNFMPDIISNLSGSNGQEEEHFHEMIRFLFELLEKTRNTETLVTKLCQRFPNTNDERQWRDLAFCLDQLQYNDRAIVNLMNNFSYFADTLCHDPIYESFIHLISNARKMTNLKHDTKALLDEMDAKIKEVRSKGLDGQNEDDSEGAKGAEEEGGSSGHRMNGMIDTDQEDEEEAKDKIGPLNKKSRTTVKKESAVITTRISRARSSTSSSNEASTKTSKKRSASQRQSSKTSTKTSSTNAKSSKTTTSRRSSRSSARRKIVVESDDDEDEDDDEHQNESDEYQFDD